MFPSLPTLQLQIKKTWDLFTDLIGVETDTSVFLHHSRLFPPAHLCWALVPLGILNIESGHKQTGCVYFSTLKHTFGYTDVQNIFTDVFNSSFLTCNCVFCVCRISCWPFFHIHSGCVFSKAAHMVRTMLKVAKNAIPRLEWKRTPVLLRATAGLRLLPAGEAQALLDQVRRATFQREACCLIQMGTFSDVQRGAEWCELGLEGSCRED